MQVTQTGASTSLAEIGRMLDRAKADRPPIAILADRVASRFVTAVLAITTLTAIDWYYIDPARAFEIALATLVITCPAHWHLRHLQRWLLQQAVSRAPDFCWFDRGCWMF